MVKPKIIFMQGEKCFLRPIENGEINRVAAFIVKWNNDELATYYMFTGQKPKNTRQVEQMLKLEINSASAAVFLICDKISKKPIGYGGLFELHQTAHKAEFRILIGEKNFWGKGYGTEVTELLTYYGFDRLNLNRIYLGFTAQNKGAGRAYEKAGYLYEGTLKEDIYRNSAYYDTMRMAITRKEYYKKYYKNHTKKFKPQ